jgi:diacylglycerol O-acyltransferase
MAIVQISPTDAAWLLLESRDTPMHVGGLLEFKRPSDAPADYLKRELERMRSKRALPEPWNLKPLALPLVGARVPLMQTVRDVDLDYHVRHSALPAPGGQRELGVLVSRLHSHQLDMHRPLWEVHLIEGLEHDRFAVYTKIHHSLIDGVSGMRMLLRALSSDPDERETPAFWAVGPGASSRPKQDDDTGGLRGLLGSLSTSANDLVGLARSALELAGAAVSDGPLQAPFTAPGSALSGPIEGQRRFATQQYSLELIKSLAKAAECTLNDIVLYLCGTALRRYLIEHARLPRRSLTAGIPVNIRDPGDNRTGTAIGMIVADLGTNVSDPLTRLDAIRSSSGAAKRQLATLPRSALGTQAVVILGGRTPVPFSLGISNVPGPREPLYFSRSRLEAIFPVSLLTHGNALNITCVSYAGTLNFGLIGARDTLPHLQRLAIYLGEALTELSDLLLRDARAHDSAKGAASDASTASDAVASETATSAGSAGDDVASETVAGETATSTESGAVAGDAASATDAGANGHLAQGAGGDGAAPANGASAETDVGSPGYGDAGESGDPSAAAETRPR